MDKLIAAVIGGMLVFLATCIIRSRRAHDEYTFKEGDIVINPDGRLLKIRRIEGCEGLFACTPNHRVVAEGQKGFEEAGLKLDSNS